MRKMDISNMLHKMHINAVAFEKLNDPNWSIDKLPSFKKYMETGEDTTLEYVGWLFMTNGLLLQLKNKIKIEQNKKIDGWHP